MTRSRRFWISVVLGVVLLCIFGALTTQRPQRELSAVFGGWGTNPVWPSKPAIRLSVTNPTPIAVHLSVYAVERKMQEGWKLDAPAFVGATMRPSEAFELQIPVATSNSSWRIRLYCQERASGLRGLADWTEETYEKIFSKTVRSRYNGRGYFVTNEVWLRQ